MKHILPFNKKTYYLTSSSIKRKILPKDIKSVLHLQLGSNKPGTYETYKDENVDVRDYQFETIKQFNIHNLNYQNLKNNDLVIFHGGDIYDISNNIRKYKLENKIIDCIKSTNYFVGISAGTVLLSKNSFLTKESTEIKYNHINEDIANIGIFDFGLNCHVDMLLNDTYFIENFKKSLPKFKDDFYMIFDGSYLKINNNHIEKIGQIITRANINLTKFTQ